MYKLHACRHVEGTSKIVPKLSINFDSPLLRDMPTPQSTRGLVGEDLRHGADTKRTWEGSTDWLFLPD